MTNGLPDEYDLQFLKSLGMGNTETEFKALVSMFESTGYGGGKISVIALFGHPVVSLELCTHGWSGCEEMIDALQENMLFWTMYWYSTTRGGLYEFRSRTVGKSVKTSEISGKTAKDGI
jgi:hypothetical protein